MAFYSNINLQHYPHLLLHYIFLGDEHFEPNPGTELEPYRNGTVPDIWYGIGVVLVTKPNN